MAPSVNKTIKNVIFDLGRVLYTFYPKDYMLTLGLSAQEADQILGNPQVAQLWNEYDRGMYTRSSLIDTLVEKFPNHAGLIRQLLSDDFIAQVINPIPASVDFFYQVKAQGYKVYILSNIFADGIAHLIGRDAFLSEADGIIASAHYQCLKPDRAIYQILLDKYHLVPEESVFIDDSLPNIEGAKALGIHGIHFTSLDDCKMQFANITLSG